MKLMQKKCRINEPKTKSANARSCEMFSNSALFSGLVWMRREAVRTNWPTVALKPERKALKGWVGLLADAPPLSNSTSKDHFVSHVQIMIC